MPVFTQEMLSCHGALIERDVAKPNKIFAVNVKMLGFTCSWVSLDFLLNLRCFYSINVLLDSRSTQPTELLRLSRPPPAPDLRSTDNAVRHLPLA